MEAQRCQCGLTEVPLQKGNPTAGGVPLFLSQTQPSSTAQVLARASLSLHGAGADNSRLEHRAHGRDTRSLSSRL